MSRDDLLRKVQSERDYWEGLLAQLDEPSKLLPGVGGTEWTVKDVIAHIAAYERWMAGLLGADIAPVLPFPPDLDGFDTDARNAWFYESYRDQSLDVIQDSAQEAYEALLAGIRDTDDETLNTLMVLNREEELVPAEPDGVYPYPPILLWEWIAQQSYEHYEQHYSAMEAWIVERQAGA